MHCRQSGVDPDALLSACPSRGLVARLGEKWALLMIVVLADGPVRFGEIRRRVQGISAKVATQTLRSLERDGLVHRKVRSTRPIEVDYSLTVLGLDLLPLAQRLKRWAEAHLFEIDNANCAYDADTSRDPS